MKFKLLLLVLFIWQTGQSQISVVASSKKPNKSSKKNSLVVDRLQEFKKTKTIFVLSNVYDKATYDSILKASWHVTPYEVVNKENFNFNDYGGSQYSYALLDLYKKEYVRNNGATRNTLIFTELDIIMYDFDKIKKELDKMSPRRRAKKIDAVFEKNAIGIASFYLYPTGEFGNLIVEYNLDRTDIVQKKLYNDDVFFNYKPGYLKNYFQQISNLLQKGKGYWMYGKKYLPELANLKKNTLYIPDFISKDYHAFQGVYDKSSKEYLDKLFKYYDYKYQIISSEELNKRIMNNEPIYYLMYVRLNTDRFLSVVNAQTGEVVYRAYHSMGYVLRSSIIKKLNKAIKKAAKK